MTNNQTKTYEKQYFLDKEPIKLVINNEENVEPPPKQRKYEDNKSQTANKKGILDSTKPTF